MTNIFNIKSDCESFDTIYKTVNLDSTFNGSRLSILICAIILASVGLNMNSTAVIIGAMLISPLMGPINGIGYSIATYDFLLLRKAIKNLLFAIIASLITSSLYFAVSPVSTAHSELLARTSPTIYDVLIALFGGFAGTISLVTKLKGNVVPGVAIATALMPPLCTAGYGLATFQFSFFFGALYLFTINLVFIALATILFSQLIPFPLKNIINDDKKKKINNFITSITLITLVPSIYFGYVLSEKEKFNENAKRFIQSVTFFDGEYLLHHEINAGNRLITLIYNGQGLTEKEKAELQKRANDFGLKNTTLTFQQGIKFSPISKEKSENEALKTEINRLAIALKQQTTKQDSLQKQIYRGSIFLRELQPLFPQVTTCAFMESYRFSNKSNTLPVKTAYVVITTNNSSLKKTDKEKITMWLQARTQNDSLRVIFE